MRREEATQPTRRERKHLRIYLGDCSNPSVVLNALRTAFREDAVGWYAVEELESLPINEHPRNPGLRWREVEGDE